MAYAHRVDEKLSKLDDKTVMCRFIGYCDASKTLYSFWSPKDRRARVRRHVIFDEERFGSIDGQSAEPHHRESNVVVVTPLDIDRSHEPCLTRDDDVVDEDQEELGTGTKEIMCRQRTGGLADRIFVGCWAKSKYTMKDLEGQRTSSPTTTHPRT
jgi:hypothetical protein